MAGLDASETEAIASAATPLRVPKKTPNSCKTPPCPERNSAAYRTVAHQGRLRGFRLHHSQARQVFSFGARLVSALTHSLAAPGRAPLPCISAAARLAALAAAASTADETPPFTEEADTFCSAIKAGTASVVDGVGVSAKVFCFFFGLWP